MSLFSWFNRKPPAPRQRPAVEPSGLLNADATVPLVPGRGAGKPLAEPATEHAANRKNERMERRELLYTVVRDAMVRAGVLSAGYKFKVLSLDQRGRQFLVMMDLAREYGGETVRLSEIEALIAQTAKTRFDILVTAVYWRINDHVAVGMPSKGLAPHGVAGPSVPHVPSAPVRPPAPIPAPAPAPVPVAAPPIDPLLAPRSAPLVPPAPPARAPAKAFDPIEADEVAAFKRALDNAAAAKPPVPAPRTGVTTRSGPLLPSTPTGFEDTEMPGSDAPAPDLSNTQYGDLR